MEIIKHQNKEQCYESIAKLIKNIINKLISEGKDKIVFGIPGGRNVSMIFNELKKKNIDWSRVHIFMVDERMVSLDSEDSNYKLAYDNFLGNLIENNKIPESNIHPFKIEKDVDSYTKELNNFGGKYDIALFSSGEDGHIAALYPNHHSINNETNCFISMDDSPKMPPKRMTMSKNMILKTNYAILMLIGESKKEAFEKFNNENLTFKDIPAKLINKINNSYVFTDLNL